MQRTQDTTAVARTPTFEYKGHKWMIGGLDSELSAVVRSDYMTTAFELADPARLRAEDIAAARAFLDAPSGGSGQSVSLEPRLIASVSPKEACVARQNAIRLVRPRGEPIPGVVFVDRWAAGCLVAVLAAKLGPWSTQPIGDRWGIRFNRIWWRNRGGRNRRTWATIDEAADAGRTELGRCSRACRDTLKDLGHAYPEMLGAVGQT